jgi:uncharacterized repeat protein (TIGR02543 family)
MFLAWTTALSMPATSAAQTLPVATQVAGQMAVGWNIGNSLEVPSGETGWGNPLVTQQLINSVKAAGFNSVRIPCAWDSHANQSTYTIDSSWLARVKQVVDYCISNGLYVVLNEHWDNGWLEEHPTYAYQTAVNAKQKTYWTQIANYFKSYDEHLLFAGTNEVHADYGTPTSENITVQQSYNQTFVDAVRATGGNNSSRSLVVQTYNTNIQHGLNYFSLPKDSATSRLIVEVHYYDPYDYTLNTSGNCIYWGAPYPTQSACTWGYESYVDDTFSKVKSKWVSAGVPVIIGEYGVIARMTLSGQQLTDHLASRQYYLKYVNSAAVKNGIKTFYWDNGVSGNGGFALFDRNSGAVVDQGALNAVMQGAGVNPGTKYTLTASTSGSGTVSLSPTGGSYASGTSVTVTATPSSGYQFTGWSGDVSGTTNPVTIQISRNTSVVASFSQITYALSVTKSGSGSGTITASPAGISCGSTCTASYVGGTVVTLTATPASGSTFGGWSGSCSGTSTCSVTMSAARSVGASFTAGDFTAPSAPSNLTASNVTQTTVTLGWTASTDNFGVVGYDIYSGSTLAGSTSGNGATIQNLLPATGYTFTVRARDAAGNVSGASNTVTVTTSPSKDVTAPSAPSNLSWAVDGMTVMLSWGAATDDVGVVAYDLYFGSFYLGAFSDPSVSMIGFKVGTPYTFTLKARDAAGNVSVASNQITVLLSIGQDTTPPSAPTNLAAGTVTSSAVALSWTASSDDVGVVVYQVYAGGSGPLATTTSTRATVGGLMAGTGYTFTVRALDAAGNVSNPSAGLSVTTAP